MVEEIESAIISIFFIHPFFFYRNLIVYSTLPGVHP